MEEEIHEYSGEQIMVSYDVNRCIHVRECVDELPEVFDPEKRPWIDPDEGDVDELASVVMACPTGALQFERMDDGPDEPVPEENTVTVAPDGPLYLHGDIEITTTDDDVLLDDTRVALCRCGLSGNKPLCDNSHQGSDFQAEGRVANDRLEETEEIGGTLEVTPIPGGPLLLDGNFEVQGMDGETTVSTRDGSLCRCGASGAKPICDGSHEELDFLE